MPNLIYFILIFGAPDFSFSSCKYVKSAINGTLGKYSHDTLSLLINDKVLIHACMYRSYMYCICMNMSVSISRHSFIHAFIHL